MITTSHFLRIKSRKTVRLLRMSNCRLREAAKYIKANRPERALHEIEMAAKINGGIDAVLDEMWERAKVEKMLREKKTDKECQR